MPGPLTGIKVFDMTVAGVGPWAASLMGGLGADVIKCEHDKSDVIHNVPPPQRGIGGVYSSCNLNKRGVDLDLKDPAQREAAYEIIRHMDVFVENLRVGTADRLGFGYEKLSQINPNLLYASSTAWGRGGPMGTLTGSDGPVQAFSAFASLNGTPGGKWEMNRYFGHVDLNTSMYFLLAILQGLIQRAKTGKGLRVDSSMLGAAVGAQTSRIAEYFATGVSPKPMGSATATTVPHQAFLCQDKQYLAVGVVRDAQWPALCQALQAGDLLNDTTLATNAGRVQHRRRIVSALEKIFLTRPIRWWELHLTRAGVPNGRFLDIPQALTHTHFKESGALVPITTSWQGTLTLGGLPWQFSKTLVAHTPAPYPGEHTEEALRQYGMDPRTVLAALPAAPVAVPAQAGKPS